MVFGPLIPVFGVRNLSTLLILSFVAGGESVDAV